MEDDKKYYDLENIESSLELLIKETQIDYYINLFKGILDEVREEKNELEQELEEQWEEENKQQEREYWNSQF